LIEHQVHFVVVEQNREAVERLRGAGFQAVAGDAADPAALIQAHIARAGMLVIATPDSFEVRRMVETARTLNSAIEVVVRTHSEQEAQLLESDRIGKVFMGEHELAKAMAAHVLTRASGQPGGARD
jgi:CPA2 family monovalent cation:H+ antiporter-2